MRDCWAVLHLLLGNLQGLHYSCKFLAVLKEMPRSLALLNAKVASGGGLGAGLIRCDDVGSVLVWVTVSESRFAAGGGLGGGLC